MIHGDNPTNLGLFVVVVVLVPMVTYKHLKTGLTCLHLGLPDSFKYQQV